MIVRVAKNGECGILRVVATRRLFKKARLTHTPVARLRVFAYTNTKIDPLIMSLVVLASRKDSFMDANQLENKEDSSKEGGGSSEDQSSLYEVKSVYGVCSSCSMILFSSTAFSLRLRSISVGSSSTLDRLGEMLARS